MPLETQLVVSMARQHQVEGALPVTRWKAASWFFSGVSKVPAWEHRRCSTVAQPAVQTQNGRPNGSSLQGRPVSDVSDLLQNEGISQIVVRQISIDLAGHSWKFSPQKDTDDIQMIIHAATDAHNLATNRIKSSALTFISLNAASLRSHHIAWCKTTA